MAVAAVGTAGSGPLWPLAVSELPPDCTPEALQTVFSTYGEVVSIHLGPIGPDNTRGATVHYNSEEAAEDAEEVLDGKYSLRRDVNRPIKVKKQPCITKSEATENKPEEDAREDAREDRDDKEESAGANNCSARYWTENGIVDGHKLWVGSLPPDITQEELMLVFSTYGKVVEVKVHGTKHPRGRGAFVTYATREAGEDAIEVLDGVYRIRPNSPWPMEVRFAHAATPPLKGGWSASPGGGAGGEEDWHDNWWSGKDKWKSDWWSGWDNHKESSWSSTSGGKGGGKKYVERPCPKCNCMVKFHIAEDYVTASSNSKPRRERQHRNKSWTEDNGGHPWERGKGGGGPSAAIGAPPSGTHALQSTGAESSGGQGPEDEPATQRRVHVFANLPDDVDETGVRWVFEQYGEVLKVKVSKDEANPGRAQAFVDFEDPYDAETSVMTLDGEYEIRNGFGPIRVKFASAQSAPY